MSGTHHLIRGCMRRRRAGVPPGSEGTPDEVRHWQQFCVEAALEVGATVRAARLRDLDGLVRFKADGSPATTIEVGIERRLQAHLEDFCPGATLVGEELGGALPASGPAVAIDPIDGTWAFIGRTEYAATSVAAFWDGRPIAAAVMNPATMELVHASTDGGSELVQVSALNVPDLYATLPLPGRPQRVLVNVQPTRRAAVMQTLVQAWGRRELGMIRSPGGSPAWALADVAKGSFTYINLWPMAQTAPYDLAAGVLLVQEAGGEVVDLAGKPIDGLGHSGPLLASVDPRALEQALECLRQALH